MPSPQRLQTAVPLDQQSVLPAVRGVPWWGAVLLATGITALGAAIDAGSNDSLGSIYKFCYLVGCVIAALAVRRRALFTAAAQPPLIAFFVSIVTLYGLNSEQASTGLKSLIFSVLLPVAADFPWMATTFVVTLALVVARWFLTRDTSGSGPAKAGAAKSRTPDPESSTPKRGTPKSRTADTRSAKAGEAGEATDKAKSHRRTKATASPRADDGTPDRARPATPKPPAATPRSPKPRTTSTTSTAERPPAPAQPSAGHRVPTGQRRPVADLGAPDLTPSDLSPADLGPTDFPAYESANDTPSAGTADSRS
ncbi:hypothetical protein IA539_00305 [Gordonia sp. zg691]|uniref:DUF6542 domain-containing protein n=1 Tax=Gordonia jinghuaiqii TaxID=2758710 RepID=UPI0016624B62|nr:DUF6542 domain-containing protein [Gordonia jinghuaiqii]MBD0859658.1 hypothetical protein [Gordonia jinghuaiqii]